MCVERGREREREGEIGLKVVRSHFFFLRLGRRPKAEAYRCPLEAGKSREMDFP